MDALTKLTRSRWLAAGLLAGALLAPTAAMAASDPPAAVTFTGLPTVHEQQRLNAGIMIAGNGMKTTVTKSPVLARGNYVVNLALGIDNIPPGVVVLCGDSTTTAGDVVTGNYGVLEYQGSGLSEGTCVMTGTVTINEPNDHITAWAASVSTGPSPRVGAFSMNEQPVGNLVITH